MSRGPLIREIAVHVSSDESRLPVITATFPASFLPPCMDIRNRPDESSMAPGQMQATQSFSEDQWCSPCNWGGCSEAYDMGVQASTVSGLGTVWNGISGLKACLGMI
eukprot:1157919-Pelagomonas_calceolata.AAC.13